MTARVWFSYCFHKLWGWPPLHAQLPYALAPYPYWDGEDSSSINKFLIEAGNAEQFDGNASVDKPLERLGLGPQCDLLPGTEVAPMPHQTIGAAWMLDNELSYFNYNTNG